MQHCLHKNKISSFSTCLSHRLQCPWASAFVVISRYVNGQDVPTVDALDGTAVGHCAAVIVGPVSLVAVGLDSVSQGSLGEIPLAEENV